MLEIGTIGAISEEGLTSLPERLIVESRGPNFIRGPLIFDDDLVDVDDIQMLVLWNPSVPESNLQSGLLNIPSKAHDKIRLPAPPSAASDQGTY